ncbi:MAG: response regulator [Deltaproteobacteria bacterium]|nr:response regulator [Deltaproteobacteria bacterium]
METGTIQLPVILRNAPRGGQLPGNSFTRHITPGGMFVITGIDLPSGSEVEAEIAFPGLHEPVRLGSLVVWSRRPFPRTGTFGGVGIKFLFAGEKEKANFLDVLRPAFHEAGGLPYYDRPYRVLIAEDNPHVRGMYHYGISRLARLELSSEEMIEIAEVEDGREAENVIFSSHFDILILDLYMPYLQGDEIIKKLRREERFSSTPVLVISAGEVEGRERALSAGADFYLEKPIVVNDLIGAVKMLLFLDRPRRAEDIQPPLL